ncbi:MAG: radical SAM protein, partial [Cyanobacteria bacterium J06559_3]
TRYPIAPSPHHPTPSQNMNDAATIAADLDTFRQAVEVGLPYKPLYVKIKIVWQCNLRCGMCNHWRDQVEPPLDLDFYKRLVDDLAELGCQKLHLTGGEPTLRPNLEALIAHASAQGILVSMTTNGTLLTPDRAHAIAAAGLHKVNISIDSPEPAIHDRVRGVPGAWERTVQGFKQLRRWMRPGKMRLNTVIGPLNYASLVGLPDLARAIGADQLNLIAMDENTPDLQRLTPWQILHYNLTAGRAIARKAVPWGLLEQAAHAYPFGHSWQDWLQSQRGNYALGYYHHHRCYVPWTHALIDHVGQVSICCMMPNKPVIGDLRQQSFRDIWFGDTYAALRRTTHLPQFEACQRCDMFLKENSALNALLVR